MKLVAKTTRVSDLSSDLEQLANGIKSKVIRAYYELGADLVKAKALCGHGQWLPFLELAEIHEKQVQRATQYFQTVKRVYGGQPKQLPSMRQVLSGEYETQVLDLEINRLQGEINWQEECIQQLKRPDIENAIAEVKEQLRVEKLGIVQTQEKYKTCQAGVKRQEALIRKNQRTIEAKERELECLHRETDRLTTGKG